MPTKETTSEYNRRWYGKNREKCKESNNKWTTANKEKVLISRRKWQAANREKLREQSRKLYAANPEKHRARSRNWQKANPEKVRARNRKKYNLPEPTRQRPEECECCGGPTSGRGTLHLDHDHKTGKFRGWICQKCNHGLGLLGDNEFGLQRALLYLSRNELGVMQ